MSEAARAKPLDYERRPRPRLSRRERVGNAIAATFAASLAILWPLWAFFVTWELTNSAARHVAWTRLDIVLIASTIAAPIGFALLVCGPLARDAAPRRR